MTPISIATEDQLSEAIVLRLLSEVQHPHFIQFKLGLKGNGYLRAKMSNWYQMAQQQVMVVLTDLDRANCLVEFRNEWLNGQPPANLIFRVAVREVESWVLADHLAMRSLIGARGALPPAPDDLEDPKQSLLKLASGAPPDVRKDLLRVKESSLAQGLGYNTRLTSLITTTWSPARAASRSPSLARARVRLAETISAFTPT